MQKQSSSTFRFHKYTWSKPWGSVHHNWEVVGPNGAIHFHVTEVENYSDSAGLEVHYCTPPEYMQGHAPSHVDCKLTGGRCWHDGTSLYASETVWPMAKSYLKRGDHESIFRMLEREYAERFGMNEEAERAN